MPSKIVQTGQIRSVATDRLVGRVTAGTGAAEQLTVAQAKTLLGLTTQILLVGTSDVVQMDITPWASQTAHQQVWRNTAGAIQISVSAAGRMTLGNGSFSVTSTFNATMWNGGQIGWAAGSSVTGTAALETGFIRDGAAGTIAARVGTQPHVLRIYNTWTSSSNYERGNIGFVSNVYTIGSYNSGAGTLRDIHFGVSGNKIGFYGTTAIAKPTTGHAAATFVPVSGVAVTDVSTFDGYTLKQVVKALRDFGLLT